MIPMVFPRTELHLVAGVTVPMRFFDYVLKSVNNQPSAFVWTDYGAEPGFTLTSHLNPAIATLDATGLLTAVAKGTTTGTVDVEIAHNKWSTMLRVVVHDRIRSLIVAHPKLPHVRGLTHRVLTVYAELEDGTGASATRTVQDVAGLPYLRFAPATHVDASGRVELSPPVGTQTVTISLDPAVGTATTTVDLVVTDPKTEVLVQVRKAKAARSRAVLFLADGFQDTERSVFDGKVKDLVNALFDDTTALQPFRRLRDSFEVWTAFVGSEQSGATIGPPLGVTDPTRKVTGTLFPPTIAPPPPPLLTLADLIAAVGMSGGTGAPQTLAAAVTAWTTNNNVTAAQVNDAQQFKAWQLFGRILGTSVERETLFGSIIGGRAGSVYRVAPPTDPKHSVDGTWFRPRIDHASVAFDERRLPDLTKNDPDTAHRIVLDKFFAVIHEKGGAAGQASRWATNGSDNALVVMLVNDDPAGGLDEPGLAVSTLSSSFYVTLTAPKVAALASMFDHEPIWKTGRDRNVPPLPKALLGDRLAHELAHAFGLMDEYELTGRPPSTAEQVLLANKQNIHTSMGILAAGKVQMANVTWNRRRYQLGAAITTVTVNAAGTEVTLQLGKGAAAAWSGRVAKTAFMTALVPGHSSLLTPPLTIKSVDTAADSMVLTIPAGTMSPSVWPQAYASNPTLLAPLVVGGADQFLVRDDVAQWMTTNGVIVDHPNCAFGHPVETPPATLPAAAIPKQNSERLIGVYMGGGHFACGVVRPTGGCKMRTVALLPTDPFQEFCFVCQYTIVELVDSALLVALDTDYPR